VRGAGTETFVRGAAILLNVFMPAVLVGEAAQESFAGHRACDVSNTVLAALGQTCTEQLQSGVGEEAANSLFRGSQWLGDTSSPYTFGCSANHCSC